MTLKVSHQRAKFKKVWRHLCRNTDSHILPLAMKISRTTLEYSLASWQRERCSSFKTQR